MNPQEEASGEVSSMWWKGKNQSPTPQIVTNNPCENWRNITCTLYSIIQRNYNLKWQWRASISPTKTETLYQGSHQQGQCPDFIFSHCGAISGDLECNDLWSLKRPKCEHRTAADWIRSQLWKVAHPSCQTRADSIFNRRPFFTASEPVGFLYRERRRRCNRVRVTEYCFMLKVLRKVIFFSVNIYVLKKKLKKSKVFLFLMCSSCGFGPKSAMAPQRKEEDHFKSRETSFLLCITYAHIDWYFFSLSSSETSHPYHSLSVSSP